MSYHTIGNLGTVTPSPMTPAEIGAAGGTAFDPANMTLYVGGGKIPIIPALLSAVIVKTVMFGGAKAGAYARSKIFKKPAMANPPLKNILPLVVIAGGAYLLLRNRSTPVAGMGDLGFSLSSAFRSVTGSVQNVVKKIAAPAKKVLAPIKKVTAPVMQITRPIQQLASPVTNILRPSSSSSAVVATPATQYQDENGKLITKEEYDRRMNQIQPAPQAPVAPINWGQLIKPGLRPQAVPLTPPTTQPVPLTPTTQPLLTVAQAIAQAALQAQNSPVQQAIAAPMTRVGTVYYQDASGNSISKSDFDSRLARIRADYETRHLDSPPPIYFTRPGIGRSLPVGIYKLPAAFSPAMLDAMMQNLSHNNVYTPPAPQPVLLPTLEEQNQAMQRFRSQQMAIQKQIMTIMNENQPMLDALYAAHRSAKGTPYEAAAAQKIIQFKASLDAKVAPLYNALPR